MISQSRQYTICIIHPNKRVSADSTPFIQAHIERLPAKIRVLHGASFPLYRDDGNLLIPPPTLPHRLSRAIIRRVFGLTSKDLNDDALKHFLKSNGVDVVLAEYGTVGVAVMDACKKARIPLVVFFRGFDTYAYKRLDNEGQRYPELFENATAICVVSRDIEKRLLNLGAPQEKLFYNPSGVDPTLFVEANPANSLPIFVAINKFVDNKGPHLNILAFAKTIESVPNAQLILIGDGPLCEACKHLAQALGVFGNVEFLGALPHTEVAKKLRNARAVVHHSIRTKNGCRGNPQRIKRGWSNRYSCGGNSTWWHTRYCHRWQNRLFSG